MLQADRVSLNPSLVSWIETLTEIAIQKRYSTAQQALAELQSGPGRFGSKKNPNLRILSQFLDTSLQINRSEDRLLIIALTLT